MKNTKLLFSLVAMLAICGVRLSAQKTLYNEGGLIYTNRNTLIHVDGDVENKNSSGIGK